MPKRVPKDNINSPKTLASVTNHHGGFVTDFEAAYEAFKRLVTHDEMMNAETEWIKLIFKGIQVVEKYASSEDKGAAKKQLAMALLTRLVSDLPLQDESKVNIQMALETLGPGIIDKIVDAANGELFKRGYNALKAFFQRICGCASCCACCKEPKCCC